jgi:Fe-S cluster assembly protein SufB
MTKFRLSPEALRGKPMLEWFAKNMPDIDFDDIYYYLKPHRRPGPTGTCSRTT